MLLTACGSSGEERETVSEDKGQSFTVEDKNVIQAKQEWCNIDVREDYIITVS